MVDRTACQQLYFPRGQHCVKVSYRKVKVIELVQYIEGCTVRDWTIASMVSLSCIGSSLASYQSARLSLSPEVSVWSHS